MAAKALSTMELRKRSTFDLAMRLRDEFRRTHPFDGWSAVRPAVKVPFPPGATFSLTLPDGEYVVTVQRSGDATEDDELIARKERSNPMAHSLIKPRISRQQEIDAYKWADETGLDPVPPCWGKNLACGEPAFFLIQNREGIFCRACANAP